MRKVMIVDDEALVRIGLQSIMDWEQRGYRIEGVFKNGHEALAAARQQPYDIILTDIKMPGMDGLELIEQVKAFAPHIHVIILSSYNDFEYTRRAIQLGVKDYISKYEMEPEELLRVLDRIPITETPASSVAEISETNTESSDTSKSAGATKATKVVGAADRHLPHLTTSQAGIDEEAGSLLRWISMKPMPRDKAYSQEERKAMTFQVLEIIGRMRQLEFQGEENGMLHGVYYELPDNGTEEGDCSEAHPLQQMAEELKAAWAKNLNIALIIGISGCKPAAQRDKLRQEAETATLQAFYEGAGVYQLSSHNAERRLRALSEQEWLEWYKQIKHKVDYLQFRELSAWIRSQLLAEEQERLLPSEWLRIGETTAVHVMNLLVERYPLNAEAIASQFGQLWPLPEAVKHVRTAQEMIALMQQMGELAHNIIAAHQSSRGWVQQIKEHVERHYSEQLRLEDMADKVNFSPNHFSQRFRQETGEPFSDYVTRIRIREAIRLYKETNYSTEEIAARVGYTNPNYFIKVFKKATGQTVKQFKQQFHSS